MPAKPAKRISKEERRRGLQDRQKQNMKNKDSGGVRGKQVLNLSDYNDVLWFKPTKGTNRIDIIPYTVTSENHPQGMKAGYEDYVLDLWVHRRIGPTEDSFVCLKRTFGKPCPICEEIAKLMQGDNPNKKQIKALQPSRRCIYNVIDLDDDNNEGKIKLFEVSHYLFEKELLEEAETAEDEVITFCDLEDGRTIRVRASQEQIEGQNYFKFKSFAFEKRKHPYKESILEEAYPLDALLVIPTYDEMSDAFFGIENDPEEETEKKSSRKNRDEDIPEDDEDEKPKGKSRRESSSKGKSRCPHGYKFGVDCDEEKECDDCDEWDACKDEKENNKG